MEIDFQNKMYLDEEAIHALDLVETKRATHSKGKSLFSVLNRCKTTGGKQLLANWLEHPLVNYDQISM